MISRARRRVVWNVELGVLFPRSGVDTELLRDERREAEEGRRRDSRLARHSRAGRRSGGDAHRPGRPYGRSRRPGGYLQGRASTPQTGQLQRPGGRQRPATSRRRARQRPLGARVRGEVAGGWPGLPAQPEALATHQPLEVGKGRAPGLIDVGGVGIRSPGFDAGQAVQRPEMGCGRYLPGRVGTEGLSCFRNENRQPRSGGPIPGRQNVAHFRPLCCVVPASNPGQRANTHPPTSISPGALPAADEPAADPRPQRPLPGSSPAGRRPLPAARSL